jgi:ubiquinone/menaquinone biosynthesis C-methylase UbiE
MAYTAFAKLYDPLMKDVDYDLWAGYITSFLPDRKLFIADCACGTGELTVRLAKAGHSLTGIDRSCEMLEIASQKARSLGLRIPFVQQDIAKFELHGKADAVICTCDGVNYLTSREEVQSFFEAAYNALKADGLLLFDISSRHKLSSILGNNTFAEDEAGLTYIWRNAYDEDSKLIEMTLTFFSKKGELYERFSETHIQRAHSETEIAHWLESTGFLLRGVYADFTKDPPVKESERMQFWAVKRV